MSIGHDKLLGTFPPGFVAPADGNYADPLSRGVAPVYPERASSSAGFSGAAGARSDDDPVSDMGLNGLLDASEERRRTGRPAQIVKNTGGDAGATGTVAASMLSTF